MEERQAPQIYKKYNSNGILVPKGYRVGIGINGAYGICPFCGKAYTEEDIKDPEIINFEHVYPSFAVQSAMNTKNTFRSIEHTFMVAVHKKCNDKYGTKLEKKIEPLVDHIRNNELKRQIITPKQMQEVLRYCNKTTVFLQFLTDWENIPEGFCYEQCVNQIDRAMVLMFVDNNAVPETLVYNDAKDFMFKCSNLGFWYKEDPYGSHLKSLEFFYDIDADNFIIVEQYNGRMRCCFCKHGDSKTRNFDKPVVWRLGELPVLTTGFKHSLGELPKFKNEYPYSVEYEKSPLLRTRLAQGGHFRKGIDDEVIFIQDGEFYVYKNGIKQDLTTIKEPMNCILKRMEITKLPDMSECVGINNFDCSANKLTSLQGSPKIVGGNFLCAENKLESLDGAPQFVGGNFYCMDNELTTLAGAPRSVGGNFDCDSNKITTLEGAPEEVGGNFWCDSEISSLGQGNKKVGGTFVFKVTFLASLNGLPIARSYRCFYQPHHHKSHELYYKDFNSADELRAWFAEYKKERDGKKRIATGLRAGTARVAAAGAVQKTKRKTKPSNQNEK